MKISNRKVIETVNAIQGIGSLSKAPRAVFALAKNLNKLKVLKLDVDESQRTIFKDVFGDVPNVKDTDPKMPQFQKEWEKILNIEVEFEPHKFSSEDLNLDLNSMTSENLQLIGWLLTDFCE